MGHTGGPRSCAAESCTEVGRAAARPSPQVPVLAVGPEGGWTDAEVALLEEKGFARMSLGPRILRTDTALIVLLGRLMEIYDSPSA